MLQHHNNALGRPKEPYSYGTRKIAAILGVTQDAVRFARFQGKLRMDDFESVCLYVASHLARSAKLRLRKEKRL